MSTATLLQMLTYFVLLWVGFGFLGVALRIPSLVKEASKVTVRITSNQENLDRPSMVTTFRFVVLVAGFVTLCVHGVVKGPILLHRTLDKLLK